MILDTSESDHTTDPEVYLSKISRQYDSTGLVKEVFLDNIFPPAQSSIGNIHLKTKKGVTFEWKE